MAIIREKQIKREKEVIEKEQIKLINYIQEFIQQTKQMDEVVYLLSYCYKTVAGNAKLKELSSVEFDTSKLGIMGSNIGNIKVQYSKELKVMDKYEKSI